MKKILVVLLGALAMQSVWAADVPGIVTVDVRRAVFTTEDGKIKLEKLKADIEKERADLEALNMQGRDLQERLKKDGAVMSADERHKLEKQMMEIANELKFKDEQLKKSAQRDQMLAMESLLPKFQKAVNELVAEHKIEMVLRSEVVMIADPKADITDLVAQKMNSIKE